MLMKGIKEDLDTWRDTLCSLAVTLNIVFYRFHAIIIKIQARFLRKVDEISLRQSYSKIYIVKHRT